MTAATQRARESLLLVGPLPPPYHGQSVSFGMLVDEVRRRGIAHRVVDLAHGERTQGQVGRFSGARVLEYVAILARYARALPGGRRRVYLTIAQSPHGFARDAALIWMAALFGHPVVGHLKGGNYDNFYAAQPAPVRWLVRLTLRRLHRLLVLGERLRGMFDFEPRLAARIAVVPNGLPEDEPVGGGPKRLPAPGSGEPVRLLFLSNLIESKGYLDVLGALALLRDRLGPGAVRCDFYGAFLTNADDARVESVEHARRLFDDAVAAHRLEDCAAFHGPVSGDEKRAVLVRSHFFLLPTRYNNEGQPVSIIEAIAYGNVVVSTDYRAIPDMVRHGVTGVLVPYADPGAIAAAVAAAVADPDGYARMSRAAWELYEREFTRRAHVERLLPQLLGTDGARPLPRAAAAMASTRGG
ncbi:MAG TPA: glycosyltransferase family 4 protein [Longimicrobium sp.]|nr:glycosyltransferase family 4 protein [Longimicrobium sp.]